MSKSRGRVSAGVILNKNTILKKSQKCQKTCLQHLNKKCLKLDSRPILYVYNLLGYGETLSEKYGKSQKMSNIFEHFKSFSFFLKSSM